MIQSKKQTRLKQQLRVEKMAYGVLGILSGNSVVTLFGEM